MKSEKISEAVVRRLPVYLRYLNDLHKREVATVSSQELGQRLDLNPAQIRKDLAYFGDFGRKGIGYDVSYLIEKIRHILNLDQQINAVLVGATTWDRRFPTTTFTCAKTLKSWRSLTKIRKKSAKKSIR